MTVDITHLAGNATSRGKAFGAARREQIAVYLTEWMESLRAAGVRDPKAYIAEFLRATDFLAAITEHAPDMLEEVRGIASGAMQPFELLLAIQLMDEEWAFRPSVISRAEPLEKCSSVAIHSPGSTWIGQNMDLGGYTDGHQLLLRIAPTPDEPGALLFTVGGMIALLGVNSRRVGVCVNSLFQLPTAREGLPVAFVVRRLLQARSAEEAAEVVRAVPHATGQHYLIADPTGISSLEASPAGVVEYCASDPFRVMHTNHPLAHEGTAVSERAQANSVARLNTLVARLATGDVGLEAIQGSLSSSDDPNNPVCRVLGESFTKSETDTTSFTTGSMISALQESSETIQSWVSVGPPTVRGYSQVTQCAEKWQGA